ncbi:MAG: hypothetical protein LQ342_004635 [Letrouitia transgressa]|nr:MAG: hypothetical protein LQ342_004635 [Letrouitia transgressa]
MSTPGGLSLSPPRTPLRDSTNGMNLETPSPQFHSAKSKQSHQPRRSISINRFTRKLDYPESISSPQSSVFHTPPVDRSVPAAHETGTPTTSSQDTHPSPVSPKRSFNPKNIFKSKSTTTPKANNATSPQPPIVQNDNIHYPHHLDTITERSSRPTLRSNSAKHRSSLVTLSTHRSLLSLRSRTSALNRPSFSLSDLPTPVVPHPSPSSSSSSSSKIDPLPLVEPTSNFPVLAVPRTRNPATSPGVPGLERSADAICYRLPQMGAREQYVGHSRLEERLWQRRQTSGLPPGAATRGDDEGGLGGRRRGAQKQRDGINGHIEFGAMASLGQHPFYRADGRGGGTEGIGWMEDKEGARGGGYEEGRREAGRGWRNGKWVGKWERFVETTCFVCCGVEREFERTDGPLMTGAKPVEERERERGDRRKMKVGGDGWMYRR